MKKVIYMVKKNPAMDNQENWVMLGRKEFMKFVRDPEAKGRFFCDLGGHDEPDDIIYIAECGIEQCKKWRKENNRHRYLKKIENQYEPRHCLSRSKPLTKDGSRNGSGRSAKLKWKTSKRRF